MRAGRRISHFIFHASDNHPINGTRTTRISLSIPNISIQVAPEGIHIICKSSSKSLIHSFLYRSADDDNLGAAAGSSDVRDDKMMEAMEEDMLDLMDNGLRTTISDSCASLWRERREVEGICERDKADGNQCTSR